MRLVTRCPACATTFKVVRDQLRISDGWVRCGRCSEVFDATLDLFEADDDGKPIASAPARAAAAEAPAMATHETLLPATSGMSLPEMDWPAADLLDLGPAPPALPTAPSEASNGGSAQEPWFDDLAFDPGAHPRQEPSFTPSLTVASPIEEAVNAQLQKALRRERIKALRRERAEQKERERAARAAGEADVAPQPEPGAAALPETPLLEAPSAPASFADAPAVDALAPRSRARRLLLLLGCLLALVALLLQMALHERDTLVAREPQLRPLLQSLCQWSGCQLSALRQIGSITIDGASFTREKEGEGYRLDFSLRNGARIPLAMPSVEVTLLDTQERALVRRVLAPAQFGAPPVLGASAERSTSLPMQLSGSEASGLGPVAGYRLIAFYP